MLKERKVLSGIVLIVTAMAFGGGFCLFKGRKYHVLQEVKRADILKTDDLRAAVSGNILKRTGGNAKYAEGEVVCKVDSEDEARRAAEAVNGRLQSWQEGTAVIAIEEDVNNFLKKYSGSPGLPTMYPNYYYSTN